jgi:NAD(P) transhydrogenase subunit alpha
MSSSANTIIGVLKESAGENRVSLTPEAITSLIKLNYQVLVEKEAGVKAFYSDADYQKAGATIVTRDQALGQSQLLSTIHPLNIEETSKLKENQILIGILNPFFNKDYLTALAKQGVTSFSLDFIPRSTRAQAVDVLSSMATVAGYKAVINAASLVPSFFPMFMTAAGTIRPAKILVLGAGVAGLQAVATARKLGAVVEVFDVRTAAKEEVQSLGGKFIEVEGAKDDKTAGGYAVAQSEDFVIKQRELIAKHAATSMVVICTAQIFGKKAPLLLTKEAVQGMMPGSVVIDLAASTGGNCELTKAKETQIVNQVKIVGAPTYPSEMPYHASKMLGQNYLNFLKLFITKENNFKVNFEDDIIKSSCLTYQKQITNERLK